MNGREYWQDVEPGEFAVSLKDSGPAGLVVPNRTIRIATIRP
jgi:hypothetical protein